MVKMDAVRENLAKIEREVHPALCEMTWMFKSGDKRPSTRVNFLYDPDTGEVYFYHNNEKKHFDFLREGFEEGSFMLDWDVNKDIHAIRYETFLASNITEEGVEAILETFEEYNRKYWKNS